MTPYIMPAFSLIYSTNKSHVGYTGKPLQGCKFALEGFESQSDKENELKNKIELWGGKVESQLTKSTTALILANKGKIGYLYLWLTR